jgi:hypothetical protein
MHWYQFALLAGAVIAAALAWNVPRAVLWISLGGLSFLASSWWHDAGFPYGAAFGAATNLAVCYAIYALAQLRYELRVWNAFHLMILIDLLRMAGVIKTHYTFAVSLELANWLAILIIGTTGILERVHNGRRDFSWRPGWVHHLRRALVSERKRPPFWKAP